MQWDFWDFSFNVIDVISNIDLYYVKESVRIRSMILLYIIAGRSLCDWSSCQEGCTKTVYTCWKIIVEYEVPGINPGDHLETPVASGKLFPNVKVSLESTLYEKVILKISLCILK